MSWRTNGGDPIGSVVFASSGVLIAAIGPGKVTAGGYANAVVALDPKSLTLKDWFTQPGIEFAAAPIVFQQGSRDVVAITTRDGRLLLLDAESLGGADHATPLVASAPLVRGQASFAAQSPATWEDRSVQAAATGAATGASSGDATRWLLLPVAGALTPPPGATANGPMLTGGVLAVKIVQEAGAFTIQPGWTSENIATPITPIIVNGVVFASSGAANAPARLHALDGQTGKALWQSGATMTAPVSGRSMWTGSGHVFLGTRDGTVYAFGFDMERGTSSQRSRWQ
jgi:outer membrane protein assembly factor BamB